jgi:hypothetical protein
MQLGAPLWGDRPAPSGTGRACRFPAGTKTEPGRGCRPLLPGTSLAPGALTIELRLSASGPTAAPAAWAQFSTPPSASLAPYCEPPRPPHGHWRATLRTVADGGIGEHLEFAGLVRRNKPLAALWDVGSRRNSAGGAVEIRQCVRAGHGHIVAGTNPGASQPRLSPCQCHRELPD